MSENPLQEMRGAVRAKYLEAIANRHIMGDQGVAAIAMVSCATDLFAIANQRGLIEHQLYKQAYKNN